MKYLVIGLGSMGKRRIRCLNEIGYTKIYGLDTRIDRCREVEGKYNIETRVIGEEGDIYEQVDAYIISVPPDLHHIYIDKALQYNKHCFIEASVVDTNMAELIEKSKRSNIVIAPSATMQFHPAIKLIKQYIQEGSLGKLSNFTYHSGQYLPDWHVYEKVSEFYVSNKETGGAREIVPFELTWLCNVFGQPQTVQGNFKKTINIEGAEHIDDTYNCLLDFDGFLGVLTVDVVSRVATRRLLINGEHKQLIWDWNKHCIEIFDPLRGEWQEIHYNSGQAVSGYNGNIGEQMYVEELNTFVDAIKGNKKFPNTLEEDYDILRLLYTIERSYE